MAEDFTSSGAIHFTGLGNGTDFDSIIQATVKAESFHKNRLEVWKADWVKKQEYFQVLNTDLLTLKSHMSSMDTMDEFLKKSVTVGNSAVLSATANSEATEGTHTIEVNQLAKVEVEAGTTAFAAKTDAVNSSGGALVFSFAYGPDTTEPIDAATTDTMTLNVPNGTTLEGLRDLINKDANNPGVRASILHDGSSYYLQLKGLDLGQDNKVTILSTTTLTGFESADFSEIQAAQNAEFRVDGWPAATWISIASNSSSDAIEGVTLNFLDTGTTEIGVANDDEAIIEQVRTFVDKVNEVRNTILQMTKFDDVKKQGALLQGNYGLQIISSKLKNVTAQKGVGFDYDDDTVSTLSQLGITTDATEGSPTRGMLLFDESIFREAITADSDAVAKLFGADYLGESNSPDFSYSSHIKNYTDPGTYNIEYTVDGAGNITSATIDGHEASISGTSITGKSGFPEAGLAITVNNLAAGNYSGEIRLKQGKAAEMVSTLDELTSSTSGPLAILERNYQDIVDNLDKKIEYEAKRLTTLERTLRLKFARLESTLGYYDQLKTSLENQVKQLSTK
ncbi:flagellar hook-associated protein 2 [Desulfobaculum xiamenense]|uniref:Flagellar hook-associated protein 2 n=1 Tax=Desulfobaculum xiamenense TaxID=995050 RepID=A0A846QFM9_9BACT|nr:flagellar filament capping protein FliD [Desulfobaculum xiamenense]NJB67596.1 flagellar hook-associated protein 2 [Desulfobaculum xiamenense]